MFSDDQVIGLIEIDTTASESPVESGVIEDLFHVLDDTVEHSPQALHFYSGHDFEHSDDASGECSSILMADLQQLNSDLVATYRRLLDRLLSVGVS